MFYFTSYNGLIVNSALTFLSNCILSLRHAKSAPALETLHFLFILHEAFLHSKAYYLTV